MRPKSSTLLRCGSRRRWVYINILFAVGCLWVYIFIYVGYFVGLLWFFICKYLSLCKQRIFFLLFFFLDKKEPKNQDLLDLSGYSSRKKRTQPKLDAPKRSHLRTVRCLSAFLRSVFADNSNRSVAPPLIHRLYF